MGTEGPGSSAAIVLKREREKKQQTKKIINQKMVEWIIFDS